MRDKSMRLTQEELKRVLHYDPDTGYFTWKVGGRPGMKGKRAGNTDKRGYTKIKIDKQDYYAHRLVFLYMDGYMPEYQVDHKKGINDDNRRTELRHVTPTCNQQNRKINISNTSGFPGVTWHALNQKWGARIALRRKNIYLGLYDSPLEAALARYTVEVQCKDWTCNHRSELVRAIKKAWPEFRTSDAHL